MIFLPPFRNSDNYLTLRDAIGNLPPLESGQQSDSDPLHRASKLSDLNLERIKNSSPGGSWTEWDESLLPECYKKKSGASYGSVYGRLEWDKPSSTITTQFIGYGNGRFGHPEQDRALSLREGALIQTFPKDYQFVDPKEKIINRKVAMHIGNAVPVKLGELIGKSIIKHLKEN